ncbi:MAG TPA: hypothetical protein VJ302_22030, partial [Blastocatellia bacterium]|nr:hypothetical protein [Blastocatellia bacterium]
MSSPRILVVLRSFYASFFSLFHLNRLAGLARRVVTISLVLVLIGNHALAVPQGMLALTRDLTYSAWFWWQAGGWAARYAKFAPQSQNSPKGWDGKGAPAQAMPEPEPQETQAERDARVVRIEVVPKQLALEAGERANFSVIGYDRNQEPVGTLPFNWSGEDEATGEKIDAQQKAGFAGSKVGTYKIRVEAAGHSAESRVTVRPNLRMSGEKPIRTYTVSSRDLPQQTRSTSSLPVTRGSIAKKAKNGLGELVARNSPLGTKVMPPILLPGEDPYGWTAENYQTADDPNTQRGNPIGQAPDGGAGSANFQIDVPLLSLKGRGLDLNLGLHYNSRLW